ncbi:MAG: ATP-dependent DNA ligase, partial [Acidimicrobiales bacterium]
MLFAEVVAASTVVAATRSRLAKVEALASALRAAEEGEVPAVASFLVGRPTQGRLGTGWRTVVRLTVDPAVEATLTVADVDTALGELAAVAGAGSAARRSAVLTELLGRASAEEQEFLVRLLTGELRQGALEGILVDAVAKAAGIGVEDVRRAVMLSGSLPATASAARTGGVAALRAFRLVLWRPIRPMLASPAASLDAALGEFADVTVEYKLDGARIQVHRDG